MDACVMTNDHGRIVIGTKNKAKCERLCKVLSSISIESLDIGLYQNLPDIEEDEDTALLNACKKAVTYAQAINIPVLAMDMALYFEGLTECEQPGLHVRRIPGFNGIPTDEQLLNYYASLIKRHGGQLFGYWEYGLALAESDGTIKESTGITDKRCFLSNRCAIIQVGHPLASLQFDRERGKYLAELSTDEQDDYWFVTLQQALQSIFSSPIATAE
jgi:XTP/dITP diphosphohydrolase